MSQIPCRSKCSIMDKRLHRHVLYSLVKFWHDVICFRFATKAVIISCGLFASCVKIFRVVALNELKLLLKLPMYKQGVFTNKRVPNISVQLH